MTQPKPSVSAELIWSDGLRLGATSGDTALVIDGDSIAGPSPVQLLVMALASCMGIDVLDILVKGRHGVTGFRTSIVAERPPDPPRRLLNARLAFHIHGRHPRGGSGAGHHPVAREILLGVALAAPGHRADDLLRDPA